MRKPKDASIVTKKQAVKNDALAIAAVTMTANTNELESTLNAFGKDLVREHDGVLAAGADLSNHAIAAGRIAIKAKEAIIATRGPRPKEGGFTEWVEGLKLQGRGNGLRSVQIYMQIAREYDAAELLPFDKAQHAARSSIRGMLRGMRKPLTAEAQAEQDAAAEAKAKAKAAEAVTGIPKKADAILWINTVTEGMRLLAENPTGLTTLLTPGNREEIRQALDRLLSSTIEIGQTVDAFFAPRLTPVQEPQVVSQITLRMGSDVSSYPPAKSPS